MKAQRASQASQEALGREGSELKGSDFRTARGQTAWRSGGGYCRLLVQIRARLRTAPAGAAGLAAERGVKIATLPREELGTRCGAGRAFRV